MIRCSAQEVSRLPSPMTFRKFIRPTILLLCLIQATLSKEGSSINTNNNRNSRESIRIKKQNLKNDEHLKNENQNDNSSLRRKAQAASSSSSSSVSSYTISASSYNAATNPCPPGVNCESPIIVIGPIEVTQPETTSAPTPSPLNRFRKIFTEVSVVFGNNADLMTPEQIRTFQQSMLDYWSYYIDSDKMFMDDVKVNYQLSLTATDYLATSRKDVGSGSSSDDNRNRKLQYNYDDYDYFGLNREATGFNISSSLYVDPYCFGCPDPQSLQIDSINPIGASLFGRRSLISATDTDPMQVKRGPVQNERRTGDKSEKIDVDINYYSDFGSSSKQNAYDYYTQETGGSTTSTSGTSSQTTTTTTTKKYTTTTSSTTIEKNNIFSVSQVTQPQPPQENLQITTTTTTTTTQVEGGTVESTDVSPKKGLVYYLRSTMPAYFNQVDDAMAFSHPEVSLFDSLVCYINFSIVVQEVNKDYWFLTCDQYLYHQCSIIEEQCYPEGEIPCIGL